MSNMRRKIGALTLTAIIIAAPSVAGVASSANVQSATAEGTSNVYRSNHGVGMTAVLSGLAPDQAHTVWAAIFNRPHNCFVPNACTPLDSTDNPAVNFRITQASRNYSDENGNTNFSGFIPKGENLQRPNRAEIHFVYVEHSDAQGSSYLQLNSPGPGIGFSIHQH
jgi:hypothetical protein